MTYLFTRLFILVAGNSDLSHPGKAVVFLRAAICMCGTTKGLGRSGNKSWDAIQQEHNIHMCIDDHTYAYAYVCLSILMHIYIYVCVCTHGDIDSRYRNSVNATIE